MDIPGSTRVPAGRRKIARRTGRSPEVSLRVLDRATLGGGDAAATERQSPTNSTINHQLPLLSRGGLLAILDVGAAGGEIAIKGVLGGGVVCTKLFGQRT